MKQSTRNGAGILLKLATNYLKYKLGSVEPLVGGWVDEAVEKIIGKIPQPKTARDVLEKSKLKELQIPEEHYEIVLVTVEYMIEEMPELFGSKLAEHAYDTRTLIRLIWVQYEQKHPNDFENETKCYITKGLAAYFEYIVDQLRNSDDFARQSFSQIYQNEQNIQRVEQDMHAHHKRLYELEQRSDKLDRIIHELEQKTIGNEQDISELAIKMSEFEEILRILAFELVYQAEEPHPQKAAWSDCRAWWMLTGKAKDTYGLMDDRFSIQMFALLLGMSDPYNIILASVRSDGLCERLNQILSSYSEKKAVFPDLFPHGFWTQFDNQLPEDMEFWVTINSGVVLNICADDLNVAMALVKKAFDQKELNAYHFPLIVNLWSKNAMQAVKAVSGIQERWNHQGTIEFLSTISYDVLCMDSAAVLPDQINHMCQDYSPEALRAERDINPGLWWKAIQKLAASEDPEACINGFLVARPLHSAVQRWLDHVSDELFSEISDSILYQQMLTEEDWDMLYLDVFFRMKNCSEPKKRKWYRVLTQIRQYCHSDEIAILTGAVSDEQENFRVDVNVVAMWSRYASKEEFENLLPLLKHELLLFWAAIVNSNYGIGYILDMLVDPRTHQLIVNILNQNEETGSDTSLAEATYPVRDFIRRYEMEDNI